MHRLHNPGPPHHGPNRHHDVLYNLEERCSRAQYGQLLELFAEQIATDARVSLRGGLDVAPPETIELTVRYERTPHGSLALRIVAEWNSHSNDGAIDGSLAELLQ